MSYLVPLYPEAILFKPKVTAKQPLLFELVNSLHAFTDDEKKVIYKAILDREHIMSTGVGNGVAIPHSKIQSIDRQALSIAVLDQGIEFNAIDGKPVTLVFLVVGSFQHAKSHLRLLSHISRSLMNLEWVNAIKTADSKQRVFMLLETIVQTDIAE
jgi:mannitol/fructose-specific phosphotransferase system IIA component (Ntr-type)